MKKKVVLITPDRNDRPELLSHCIWQMQRQTVEPFDHLVINHEGIPGVIDIVPRIKEGINRALELEADYCLVIENDDYYPDNYIETMMRYMDLYDIIGSERSIYYCLQENAIKFFHHPGRASLFLTGFKPQLMSSFNWPVDTMLYFDIHLWAYFKGRKGFVQFKEKPIGMKHGVGFSPGNYHNGVSNGRKVSGLLADPGRKWLKQNTRAESFDFYKQFK